MKMLLASPIILAIALTLFHYRPIESASCCGTSGGSGSGGGAAEQQRRDMSAEDQRDMWLRGVDALDRLHRYWFQRRVLEALHIADVPPEATQWRRRRDQQRRSISSAERSTEEDEEQTRTFRRYTLRIIGVPESDRTRRAHRRRHNTDRHPSSNNDCGASETSAVTYSFVSKLPVSIPQLYESELESAELELWRHSNDSLPRLHVRHRSSGGGDEQQPTAQGPTGAAWFASDGWSPFRLIETGGGEAENGSLYVSDVTQALRAFWSSSVGANVTISLVPNSNQDDQGAPCIRSVAPRGNRRHHRRHHPSIDESDDDSTTRPPIVLKLSLIEKPIQRGGGGQRKRSINSNNGGIANLRPTNRTGGGGNARRTNRQLMIEDCHSQWDPAFFRDTTDSQYDELMPCCRRRVEINFQQLGWGSWVISPASFYSYYCMGRCTNFGGFASSDTEGAAFYTETMNIYREARNSGLTPCCSPVKFSPLTITVLTGDNEEMTQTLEDVIVKQCGCM